MSEPPQIAMVLGTRPEIIKLSPVIRECEREEIPYILIHTGQHYSDELDGVFFDQLDLPAPDYNLEVGSQTHGRQTGEMIAGIEDILLKEEPDVVLVQGDTNSVLAGAIATSKLDVKLGHVEAGLRSFDRGMPEETNRVLTDHAGDYLFAPTDDAASLLRREGVPEERIHVTGNTVVDAVHQNRQMAAEKSSIRSDLGVADGEFGLMTAHRAENVDKEDRFERILRGVSEFAALREIEILYPIHPRAKERLDEFGISVPDSIRLIPPQDYLDFLVLEDTSRIVFTDSGGVQEEACILETPCVTVRDNTERPETVDVGSNVLVGTDPERIVTGGREMVNAPRDWMNPFGDGRSAGRILGVVHNDLGFARPKPDSLTVDVSLNLD